MSSPFVYITARSTVNDVSTRFPATSIVFRQLGVDTVAGAQFTLREAARAARTDLGIVLSMLEASAHESSGSRRLVDDQAKARRYQGRRGVDVT